MNICVFGDSIAWGDADEEKGGWVDRLRAHYLALEGEDYIDVYNLGIPGNTTEDLVKRFDSEAGPRRPDVVVFAIGINDAKYIQSGNLPMVALEKFSENIAKLERSARFYANKVVFIGLTRVDESRTMPIGGNSFENESIARYDDALRDFCMRSGCLYIEMSDVVKLEDLYEGLHPNARGHQKMFERVLSSLQKVDLFTSKELT